MSSGNEDTGLSTTQLWRCAWVLGLAALGAVARLGQYAVDDTRVRPEHLVWLAICIVASVFSVCCALLVAVKSAEARLTQKPPPGQASQAP